jgi:hypothetical protein
MKRNFSTFFALGYFFCCFAALKMISHFDNALVGPWRAIEKKQLAFMVGTSQPYQVWAENVRDMASLTRLFDAGDEPSRHKNLPTNWNNVPIDLDLRNLFDASIPEV